jgi:hypothetical protein
MTLLNPPNNLSPTKNSGNWTRPWWRCPSLKPFILDNSLVTAGSSFSSTLEIVGFTPDLVATGAPHGTCSTHVSHHAPTYTVQCTHTLPVPATAVNLQTMELIYNYWCTIFTWVWDVGHPVSNGVSHNLKFANWVLYQLLANSCYRAARKMRNYDFLLGNLSLKSSHWMILLGYPRWCHELKLANACIGKRSLLMKNARKKREILENWKVIL